MPSGQSRFIAEKTEHVSRVDHGLSRPVKLAGHSRVYPSHLLIFITDQLPITGPFSHYRKYDGGQKDPPREATRSTSSGPRRMLHPAAARRGSRFRTGRAGEREHASIMRRSSIGQYGRAPLIRRPVGSTGGSGASASLRRKVIASTSSVHTLDAETDWPWAGRLPAVDVPLPEVDHQTDSVAKTMILMRNAG